MNYGQVSSPANKDKKSKKRKKLLIIAIPVIAVIASLGVVLSQNGMTGLMGNSVCNYTCESGWELKGSNCYQESAQASEKAAYLVGDVVNEEGDKSPDGKFTLNDWSFIRSEIKNKKTLTEDQKLIYDLNGDGTVNDDDISSDFIPSTSTSGQFNVSTKYVCPKNKVEDVNDENGNKKKTTIEYQLNQKKCNIKTTIKIEKKATCNTGLANNSTNTGTETDTKTATSSDNSKSQNGYTLKEETSLKKDVVYKDSSKIELKYRAYKNDKTNGGERLYYILRTYGSDSKNDDGVMNYISDCKSTNSWGQFNFFLDMGLYPYKYFTIELYKDRSCGSNSFILQKKSDVYKTKIDPKITEAKEKKTTNKLSQDKVIIQTIEPKAEAVKTAGRYTIKYKYKIIDEKRPYRYVIYRWNRNDNGNTNVNSKTFVSKQTKCLKVVDGMEQTFDIYTMKGRTTTARLDVYPTVNCRNNGFFDGSITSQRYIVK